MSNNFTKRGVPSQGQQQIRVNINPVELEDVTCVKCGGILFEIKYSLKLVPKTHPAHQQTGDVITLQRQSCIECGTLIGEGDKDGGDNGTTA